MLNYPVYRLRNLFILYLCMAMSSCQQSLSTFDEVYLIDGQQWALGRVSISPMPDGQLFVERLSNAQTESAPYRLMGTSTVSAPDAAAFEIDYVDYHPEGHRIVLSMTYRKCFSVEELADGTQRIHLSVQLLHQVPTADDCQEQLRYIGSALLNKDATMAPLILDARTGVKLAQVIAGPSTGAWAMHHSALPYASSIRVGSSCSDSKGQPGQYPVQKTPGQNDLLEPGPNAKTFQSNVQNWQSGAGQSSCSQIYHEPRDVCDDDPRRVACLDRLKLFPKLSTLEDEQAGILSRENLELIQAEYPGFYQMAGVGEGPGEAKLVFSSAQVEPGENPGQTCQQHFHAIARTADGRVHPACALERASPEQSGSSSLTCAIRVQIFQAQRFQDKVCVITGVFPATGERFSTLIMKP